MHVSANATISVFIFDIGLKFDFEIVFACLYLIKVELNTPLWGPWGLISLGKHCPEAQNCQDVTEWNFVMVEKQFQDQP